MAITLYEIIASDTISQMADKVNYNFDQLLQNGGGPAGPQGPQGPFGPTGPQGVSGPQGVRGTKWFEGGSFPTTGIITGDLFLENTGLVYEYNGTTWVATGIDLTGTGTIWDQLDGSSTSISTSLPLYRFRYLRPSPELATATSDLSNEQAVLVGGAPFGAADDQGIGGTPVDYISDVYAADVNTDNGSLFVHAPKDLGVGKNIILSRVQGDGASTFNTDVVSDMSYITLDVADGIEIIGQKRVTNSSIFSSYPNGININALDSQVFVGAGRNILLETYNPVTGYSSGIFGADNSVGNITLWSKESTLSGYAGAALTLKKGTSGALGDAIIVLGNANPTGIPLAGDASIYIKNAGTSADISIFSGRSIVTTSGRSFAINTPGTSNIGLDVRGATASQQLISVKTNAGSEAFGLSTSGRLTQALAFPAAGVPSNDPYSLDYYEEGAWTPALTVYNPGSISGTFGTSGTSFYSVKKARYTRVGNTITVDAVFNITVPGSVPCPGAPDYFQSGLIVTGFPYNPDIENSSVASSGVGVEYGMPFYSAGAHNISGACSTNPIAGTVKASFYCASTSGVAMAFYVNNDPGYIKSMRRLSFVDYQGSTDGVLNFSASYLISGAPAGNPCSGATSGTGGTGGTGGTSGTGNGTGFAVLSQVQVPLTPNSLAVDSSLDLMTWSPVLNTTNSLVGTSSSTSTTLNTTAYYRATLTNNTFGTSTTFQGLTWSISSSGVTSIGPISTSAVSTGSTVTWYAPSPWTAGERYIWEGRFTQAATFVQLSNITGSPGTWRIQTFEVGSSVPVGTTYYVGVYSVTVSYTSIAGDTAFDVASGLVAAVNSTTTSQWNLYGSAPIWDTYFPPYASVIGGGQFEIQLNYSNQFGYGILP